MSQGREGGLESGETVNEIWLAKNNIVSESQIPLRATYLWETPGVVTYCSRY